MAATVIYDTKTGDLVSFTVSDPPGRGQIASPLPAGLSSKKLAIADPAQPPGGSRYVWNPVTLDFDVEILPRPAMSKSDFLDRFTDIELAAIYTSTDAAVIVEREKFNAAAEIPPDDQRLADGLDVLTAAGILAAGRKDVILA